MLRLRLRVAMFKVQTNQTNLPMSRLRISPNSPPSQSQNSGTSPERTNSLPRLLPAPELRPTAYSARMIPQAHPPSSPPSSRKSSPDGNVQEEIFRKPALPKDRTQPVDLHLSSPPDSDWADREGEAVDPLTSSAVRGSVARSLLGLAQANQ